MKELAMHVYDLMENSTAANASNILLTIRDDKAGNRYDFCIQDDGKGMSPELLQRVTDPYTTSRTTRKVGLGLPLIKQNCERCNGGMEIQSTLGQGTTLHFWFEHNNWDRPPMGDLSGTIVLLCSAHEDIHITVTFITNQDSYTFDTNEIKEALDGVSMNDVHIMAYLKEMIQENLEAIGYSE